ncbi:hypothetical protein [Luteolibacter sp. AS25]|uniref:hypothetical protein n=1 Tax=Luteolibacter sp. AS25 TaxID=3135776 RepID=UPI00398A9144
MPKITSKIVDRIEGFRVAWREMAPDAVFAGMTYEQFVEASEPPLTVRDEILALESKLSGKKAEKLIADDAASEMLALVVNSVRGTQGYGDDCSLYRAFGFVRKSERKSGLTRKSAAMADEANAN